MQPPTVTELHLRDRASLQQALQSAGDARALLLVAHADEASQSRPGHGFVADVLRANGFASLPFCLRAPGKSVAGARPLGLRRSRQRIHAVIDWLAPQPALAGGRWRCSGWARPFGRALPQPRGSARPCCARCSCSTDMSTRWHTICCD
jgi:hypothetical protein